MNYKFKILSLSLSMVLLMSSISYAVQDMNFNIGKELLKLVFCTLALIFVLIVTIYGTKFIAKNTRKFANSKYMQIIDIIKLGTNVKIVIMKTNSIVYILAITNNTIETIDKFPEEEFDFDKETDFQKQLDKYKCRYIHDNDFFNKFWNKVQRMLNKSNKFIGKEDEDNEKKC